MKALEVHTAQAGGGRGRLENVKEDIDQDVAAVDSKGASIKKIDVQKAALAYGARDWRIFPIPYRSRAPRIKDWPNQATSDPEKLKEWFSPGSQKNIGLLCGLASGVVVLDVDIGPKFTDNGDLQVKNDVPVVATGDKTLAELANLLGSLPKTLEQISGNRHGRHKIFKHPPGTTIRNGVLAHNIDIKSCGGQIVVAPSIHPSGGQYQWVDWKTPIAELPAAWIEHIRAHQAQPTHDTPERETPPMQRTAAQFSGANPRYMQAALDGAYKAVAEAVDGTQNQTTNDNALHMFRYVLGGHLKKTVVEAGMFAAATASGLVAKDGPTAVRNTIASAWNGAERHGPLHPPQIRATTDNRLGRRGNGRDDDTGFEYPPLDAYEGRRRDNTPKQVREAPEIKIQAGERPRYLNTARGILQHAGGTYQRGKSIVRVVRYNAAQKGKGALKVQDGTVFISAHTSLSLATYIDSHATVVKFSKRENKWLPADFPDKDAAAIIADVHSSRLPFLQAVIASPAMRPDGSIIQEQGYDPATCLYLDTGGIDFGISQIPANPTREDAQRALETLDELIGAFPFVDGASKSVALAGMLTAPIRPTLPAAPMPCFSAPTYGSGKSLLARLAALLATGKEPATLNYSGDEVDFRKEGAALLMQGFPVACLDNVNGTLESVFLSQALTQPELTVRVLGFSEMVVCPTATMWLATGNNIEPRKDLTRRVLFCEIDPQTDRPDARRFDFEPTERLMQDRPRYVRAALTVLKAYHAAGRPKQDIEPYGGFDVWSDTVRSALVWAGCADPCAQREKLELNDRERMILRALLSAWWESSLKDRPVVRGKECGYLAKEILDTAGRMDSAGELIEPDLHAALVDICAGRDGRMTSNGLGTRLNKIKGKIESCAGENWTALLRIVAVSPGGRRVEYHVEQVRPPISPAPASAARASDTECAEGYPGAE
jgi:hypothetical protein